MYSDSGELRWILIRGIARRNKAGRAFCVLGSAIDITGRKQLEDSLPEFFRTGQCHNVPYQVVKANGDVIDVLHSAVVERDEQGSIVRSLAVMTDITEQRRAEAEYSDIFNNATEGIYGARDDRRWACCWSL